MSTSLLADASALPHPQRMSVSALREAQPHIDSLHAAAFKRLVFLDVALGAPLYPFLVKPVAMSASGLRWGSESLFQASRLTRIGVLAP